MQNNELLLGIERIQYGKRVSVLEKPLAVISHSLAEEE